MATEEVNISLRPLSLRPGGAGKANPFAAFGKGAGVSLKNRVSTGAAKDERKKPAGEVLRYTRDYLMKFAEVYSRLPTELQYSNLEILLEADDPEREAQKQLLAKVAATVDESDERDWRSRQALPPLPSGAGGDQQQQPPRQAAAAGQQQAAPPRAAAGAGGGEDASLPKIQRAAETGKVAWIAGTTSEGTEQTMRKVKGILNKLTPEKFDRLLSQLIPLITSFEVLQATITQVFENAVQQPTFVAMYADLCHELDQALPEFAAPGEEKGVSFKKMLANTCQEEYEATEVAREKVRGAGGDEREEAERRVKQRLLGNIRLISELFKKGMVNDRIMLLILSDLLGPADSSEPSEDNVEAVCEMLSTAGGSLERNPKSKPRLDAAFAKLERLAGATKTYPSRIRFVIRDVLDLRAQHWVARREVFTAKKLEEIRSEAQAELGIVDVSIPGLDALPAMPGLLQPKRPEELELFPAFKSSDAGWAAARGNRPTSAGNGKYSAFLGDYVPLAEAAAATPPQAPGQAPRAPRKDLAPEQRESLGKSLFSDYLSSPSLDEAVGAAQELDVPGFMPRLVALGLEKAFDTPSAAEQRQLVDLLGALAGRGMLSADDLKDGTAPLLEMLEDLSLDTPSAPRLLGRLLGSAAVGGLLGLDYVLKAAGAVESAEPRRGFVAAALQAVQEAGGEGRLVELCKEAGLSAGSEVLAHDPQFDGDLPGAKAFLEKEGLAAVASL